MSWQKLWLRSRSVHIGSLSTRPRPCWPPMMSCSWGGSPCQMKKSYRRHVYIEGTNNNIMSRHEKAPRNITNTYKQGVYFGFIAAASHLVMAASVCYPCLALSHRDSADGSLACCVSNAITHLSFANRYKCIAMFSGTWNQQCQRS